MAGEVKKKSRGQTADVEKYTNARGVDIANILKSITKWSKMPRVQTDEECRERLEKFFAACIKGGEYPTIEKMALALGFDRRTIWEWREKGTKGPVRQELMKKAQEMLAAFDSEMAAQGLMHYVLYQFRAKNYYGMDDRVEHILTPGNPLGDIKDINDLDKYVQDTPMLPEETEESPNED